MSSTQNPLTGLTRTPFLADDGKTVSWSWLQFFYGIALAKNVPAFVSNTHSHRSQIPAANYANGTLFFESDRGVVYIAVNDIWHYFIGTMQDTQANLPSDLGLNDLDFLYEVTDYAHLLLWNGTGWTWGPAEDGSDFIVQFLSGPNPQTGWQKCDGSAGVGVLQSDGTLQFVTVPTIANSWYRQ
jgi:hypothetical protein